jgi:hypothetical protein
MPLTPPARSDGGYGDQYSDGGALRSSRTDPGGSGAEPPRGMTLASPARGGARQPTVQRPWVGPQLGGHRDLLRNRSGPPAADSAASDSDSSTGRHRRSLGFDSGGPAHVAVPAHPGGRGRPGSASPGSVEQVRGLVCMWNHLLANRYQPFSNMVLNPADPVMLTH